METRKLYYENCHLQQFEAVVMRCTAGADGYEVVLDQTAFYPEGGGQACDLGQLGGVSVLDVQQRGEQVVHLCDGPLTEGETVWGQIDWARRFDLMQQHTGEHLLSGIIFREFGYHNSGFHVGAQVMEVDFDGPIPQDKIWELEAMANQLVWQNLPVNCSYPEPQELEKLSYRTKRALPWPVRIVQIPGADTCACCGVHVGHTGEVGLIKIISCVKFHSGVRLEMVCGERAYRYITAVFDQNRQVSQLISAKMTETAQGAQKLYQQLAAEKSRAIALERQLFDSIALQYRDQEDPVCFAADLTPGAVRELTERIRTQCKGVATVLSGKDGQGYTLCLMSADGAAKELGTKMVNALNGRGGGKPEAFQGSLQATRAQIQDFLSRQ